MGNGGSSRGARCVSPAALCCAALCQTINIVSTASQAIYRIEALRASTSNTTGIFSMHTPGRGGKFELIKINAPPLETLSSQRYIVYNIQKGTLAKGAIFPKHK